MKRVLQLPFHIHSLPTVQGPLLLIVPQLLSQLPHRLEDLSPKYSTVPKAGIHLTIHVVLLVMDLTKTPLKESLWETFQVKNPHVLPPPLLPSHHQIPKPSSLNEL